jgi:RNA polymerase sigma-54 factor
MLEAEEEGELSLEAADAEAREAAGESPSEVAADSHEVAAEDREQRDEPTVEIGDDHWDEGPTVGPSDTPWSGDDDRAQEYADERGETLQDHLLWQLELARLGERELAIGRAIIDAINDDGYVVDPLDEIRETLKPDLEVEVAEIEGVLKHVQGFDPVGIGARSVGECIELQLAQLAQDTPGLATALRDRAQPPRPRRHPAARAAAAQLRVDEEELERALALVRGCHPRPGSQISRAPPSTSCRTCSCVAASTAGWSS